MFNLFWGNLKKKNQQVHPWGRCTNAIKAKASHVPFGKSFPKWKSFFKFKENTKLL